MAGGRDQQDKSTNILEIVDLVNPNFKCKWNDERAARAVLFGAILQNQPLLFGGFDTNYKALKDGIILGSNDKIYKYEIFFGKNEENPCSICLQPISWNDFGYPN